MRAWNMTGQADVDYAAGEVWEVSMDILTFLHQETGSAFQSYVKCCECKLTTAIKTFHTHLSSL